MTSDISSLRRLGRSRAVSLIMALCLPLAGWAQEQAERKPFFLPKNPVAAAYILGRLSNKELVEAPRSEPVYSALLARQGLERKYRVEALEGLAKLRNTDSISELITGLGELGKKAEESEPVLRELAGILLSAKAEPLAAKRSSLVALADESPAALVRQIACAALMTADGSINALWKEYQADASKLEQVILAIPLVRDARIRTATYPKVRPLLDRADSAELLRAAITAIAAVPDRETETFIALSKFISSETERSAAVASVKKISRKSWPKDQAEPMTKNLLDYMRLVPIEQRTEPDFVNAYQLAGDLASLLPTEKRKEIERTLRDLGVSIIVVRTIPEQMLYDKPLLVVEAGKPVEITLINDDAMLHNLVIVQPGTAQEIGEAAEKMTPDADALGRTYVPDSSSVLHATKMIDPGQQTKLSFTAPEELGDYQYVCTFPGHWRRMVGTLAVVEDVEAYLASRAALAEPTITEWTVGDFASDLTKLSTGRNLADGRDLFTKMACAQCHKLGRDGYNFGPELSDVFKRYNNDRAEVLRHILTPSSVVADRYRNFEFELNDGDSVSGMIVKEDAENVTLQTGPADTLIQSVKKAAIRERRPLNSSLMPVGLLYSLSKAQILDLLAFMEAEEKAHAQAHQH